MPHYSHWFRCRFSVRKQNIFIVVCHNEPNANDSKNNPIFINIFSMRMPFLLGGVSPSPSPSLSSSHLFLSFLWLIHSDSMACGWIGPRNEAEEQRQTRVWLACASRRGTGCLFIFRFQFRIYLLFLFSHVKRHHYHINVKRLESYFVAGFIGRCTHTYRAACLSTGNGGSAESV